MALLTATEVTILSNISCSAATITANGFIPEVTQKINLETNNYFTSQIYIQETVTFDPSALTIVGSSSFESYGFANGDEIFIAGSYRNDGYQTVATVSDKTLTLASGSTIYNELSGANVFISLVVWPKALKRVAAQMIAYDYDKRNKQSGGLKSHSLGPFSETFAVGNNSGEGSGYPPAIMDLLIPFRIARVL